MNREQAEKFFKEHNTRYVLAQFVDIHASEHGATMAMIEGRSGGGNR